MTLSSNNTQNKKPTIHRTQCGTYAGFGRHRAYGELSCNPCLEAKKEYRKKYVKSWSEKNKEKVYEYNKTWLNKNLEKRIKWQKNNKAKIQQYKKSWRVNNPDKIAEFNSKRRALKNEVNHMPYSLEEVLKTYGTTCYLCGTPIDLLSPRATNEDGWEKGLQIDHVLPISRGGNDSLNNVRPSHGQCNLRKGTKTIGELMSEDFEPEIDPTLFDEDLLDELEEDLVIPDDYDDHYNDDQELAEEDK